MLLLAAGSRLSFVGGYLQNRGDDDVTVPGVAQHTLPFLPIRKVKTGEIDIWLFEIVWGFHKPWPQRQGEILAGHYRLAPEYIRRSRQQATNAVDLDVRET